MCKYAKQFLCLIESKGFQQHVTDPTHISGNILDLVLSLKEAAHSVPLKNMIVESDRQLSDHYLVHFQLPLKQLKSCQPMKELKEYRELHKIDVNQLRFDIEQSVLFKTKFTSLNDAVQSYSDILYSILYKHAPLMSKQFNVSRSPWWNETFQQARREQRMAKRKFNKHKDDESKIIYNEKCVDVAITQLLLIEPDVVTMTKN